MLWDDDDHTYDYVIRLACELFGHDSVRGFQIAENVDTAGRAILINAVTITAGQLVFLAAELIPLHYFGALLAVAMVTSALAAVTVMPAVLLMTSPKFLRRKNF